MQIGHVDVYRRLVNRDLPWVERTCTSKVPIGTRTEARAQARDGRRSDGSLRPYHCHLEEHWHLAHRRHWHPSMNVDDITAPRRRRPAVPVGPDWLSREWWSTRPLRHFRPPRSDRSWREAWATA